jgi:hypothetical protein
MSSSVDDRRKSLKLAEMAVKLWGRLFRSQISEEELLRFKRRSVAWSLAACSSLFLLIGLSGLLGEQAGTGSFLFFAGLTALSLLLIVRTFRMATIIVEPDSVLIRGFVRSRRIPIETIRNVEAIAQPSMYGRGGMTIAVHTVDGRRIVAGEFWSPTAQSGRSARIDAIVRELNERCTAQTANASAEVSAQVGSKGSP